MYFFGKKFATKCHQSVGRYNFKPVSFSLFDQCDHDKPEKMNISLLSGIAFAYEHCVTIKCLEFTGIEMSLNLSFSFQRV